MVFNRQTYPNLFRLFQELNVPIKNADMSFSVQHFPLGIEYCGSSLNQLFAQRKNLIRPKFWRMLLQINRFNKEAVATLQSGEFDSFTLAEYVKEKKFSVLNSILVLVVLVVIIICFWFLKNSGLNFFEITIWALN